MQATHQDTLMREHFILGLRKSTQCLVTLKDPGKFSEAVRVAKGIGYNDEYVDWKAPWLKTAEHAAQPRAATWHQGPASYVSTDPVTGQVKIAI